MLYFIIFSILSASSFIDNVKSAPTVGDSPCDRSDADCLTDITKLLYKQVVVGDKELGIEPSDPLHVENVVGDFSDIRYVLSNTTFVGFKECEVKSAELTEHKTHVLFKMVCPKFHLTGDYTVDGKIIGMPINGDGPYDIELLNFKINVQADIKRHTGADGKTHISFSKIKIDADLTGGMNVQAGNLFGGNKELGDTALTFIHENWKIIADNLQMPVLQAYCKKLFINVNKLLKNIPVEYIIKQ